MRTLLKIAVIAIFIVISNYFYAYSEEWVQYTNGDEINAIAEEGEYLWIGTNGGLIKYNKETGEKTFINSANSGLYFNDISAITIDKYGNKWIGTRGGGVSKFDGTNWDFYITSNSGIPGNYINCLITDTLGNLWIGTDENGLAKFDGVNWEIERFFESISDMAIDKNKNLWVCSGIVYFSKAGVAKYDGNEWIILDSSNSDFPTNSIYSIAIDSNNNKWFGTFGNDYIFKYNDTISTVYNNTDFKSTNKYIQTNTIAVEPNGDIWFGIIGGILKYDGISWLEYHSNNSDLSDDGVNVILITDNNIKWIGTYSGFNKLTDNNLELINIANSGLPSNYVNVVAIDKNNDKWFGMSFGNNVLKFNENGWERFDKTNSGMIASKIFSIFIDKYNNKWFGTDSGIVIYDGLKWTNYNVNNSELPSNMVKSIAEDTNGDKWIATDSGLAILSDNKWNILNKTNSKLPENNITAIAISNSGEKWVGTKSGVVKINGLEWMVFYKNSSFNSILIDKYNNKWFGTKYGLLLYDNNVWKSFSGKKYNFLDNNIKNIAYDSSNNLWFSNVVLVKYSDTTFTNFDMINSGLTSTLIYSIAVDQNNNKWFGTADGISVLIAESISVEDNKPNPSNSILFDAIPNPFTEETEISFKMEQAGIAKLTISDVLGKPIAVLINDYFDEGQHSMKFKAGDYNLSDGIYYCTITVNGLTATKMIVLVK